MPVETNPADSESCEAPGWARRVDDCQQALERLSGQALAARLVPRGEIEDLLIRMRAACREVAAHRAGPGPTEAEEEAESNWQDFMRLAKELEERLEAAAEP